MSPKHLSVAGLVIGAGAILAGCATATPAQTPPALIKPVAGSPIPQLQLTERAVQRLGILTQPVRPTTTAGQPAHEVIPYSAVVYDTDGSTWAYVNTAARTYERKPITVTEIDGTTALLSAGPAAGTAVVTVGAAELLGTEYDISGEE
ncbi:MAG TPA: hypothetical protein VJ418_04145 [Streptosporangiaceae bacterium]|jgi:hypothetical protein|nr:hypothetical protein [Streptosporangiaceae bacterium]